jgi:hypothetical protein
MTECPNCGEPTIRGHYVRFGPDGSGMFVCSIVNAYGERDEDGNPIEIASQSDAATEPK